MKNIIILEKAKEKILSEGSADIIALIEVAQASSPINLAWKYKWAMSNVDIDVAKKLGLTGFKKY